MQLKHSKDLTRMRQITAQLIALGDPADMYFRGAKAALKEAVDTHPDVLAAQQSLLGMDSAEN
eukprot:425468-Prymnesium_polylepis.1